MERTIIEELQKWKTRKGRKPLIIRGARQVGKTWVMKEFGIRSFSDVIYISFDEMTPEANLFDTTKSARQIIDRLQIVRSKTIDPGKSLIILDEIQESANALGSLKYFAEQAPEYYVVAAGSLLGTYLTNPVSYPVGKVNLLNMYPVTFGEFLKAGHKGLFDYYESVKSGSDYTGVFHDEMMDIYREYLIVGGMPECVDSWVSSRNPEDVLEKQNELITLYENDFTKHNKAVNAARILQVFRSIPAQLAKESNERFIYGAVRKGGRARDFEEAISWLVSAGVVNQIFNVSQTAIPLKPYENLSNFKLFLFDTGLLKYCANVPNSHILLNEDFSFKGPLNENYVLQQLVPQMHFMPNFYGQSNFMELDFVIQKDDMIIPVEVKSGKGKKAASFKRFIEKHNPQAAIRLSANGYMTNGKITNIPLYFAGKVFELIK